MASLSANASTFNCLIDGVRNLKNISISEGSVETYELASTQGSSLTLNVENSGVDLSVMIKKIDTYGGATATYPLSGSGVKKGVQFTMFLNIANTLKPIIKC